MLRKSSFGIVAVICVSIFVVKSQAQQELPSAEKVIAKYIEKTGGRMKYEAVKNAAFSGEMSIPAQGVNAKVQIAYVAPNKFYFKADMGEFVGTQERGSDGKIVWENSTVQGPRLIKGDEAEQLIQEISMGTILNPLKFYKSIKTTGKEKVKDEECYVIELTKKNGKVDKDYYSVKSGLRIKSVKKVETPVGEIDVESFETNYQKANNGLILSRTSEQKLGVVTMTLNMKSVEFNGKVNESLFQVPDEVKELIEDK